MEGRPAEAEVADLAWGEFERVQLCVGTVLEVVDLPDARKPAYVLTIDFGPHGTKRSSAQITVNYTKEELVGRQVLAVINFPPKRIGSIISECLVTGFADGRGGIVLAAVERPVPNGSRLV
jgi:tRNA-binding protein